MTCKDSQIKLTVKDLYQELEAVCSGGVEADGVPLLVVAIPETLSVPVVHIECAR